MKRFILKQPVGIDEQSSLTINEEKTPYYNLEIFHNGFLISSSLDAYQIVFDGMNMEYPLFNKVEIEHNFELMDLRSFVIRWSKLIHQEEVIGIIKINSESYNFRLKKIGYKLKDKYEKSFYLFIEGELMYYEH